MDFKEKELAKRIGFFLDRWGRGKRHVPSKPKPPPPAVKAKPEKVKKVKKVKVKKESIGLCNFNPMFKGNLTKPLSNPFSYGAWLQKHGFKRLGSGCFTTVYAKDGSDKVIRVTHRPDNWIDYVQWAAKKGYCGTYAPKVYSYKKHEKKDFAVSVVERMEKEAGRIDCKDDLYVVSYLLYPAMHGNTMAGLLLDEVTPGLARFLLDFQTEFGHTHVDIYGSNMMIRKNGTFCITDPVAGQSNLKINRLRSRDFTSLAPAIRGLYEIQYH